MLRGRPSTSFPIYDEDGNHVRTVTASPWTEADRALMLAFQLYESSLCPGGCGQPKALAHHPDNDGWYGIAEKVICHACTALKRAANEGSKEPVQPVEFHVLEHDRDYGARPLPVFNPDAELRDLGAFAT